MGRTFSEAVLDGASRREIRSGNCSDWDRLPKGTKKFDKDEHNRPDTTMQTLSKLKPAFRKDGTITAGNAPGLNTAASAMIVADRSWSPNLGMEI